MMNEKINYIDTHAHLNLSAFNEDRAAVLEVCREKKVAHINVGTKASTSQLAVEIADLNDDAYAIIGLHPIQTAPGYHDEDEIGPEGEAFKSKGEEVDPDFYRELAKNKKVVGIGETGFDYFHLEPDTLEKQEAAFIAQIELANELQLPLMIHTRNPKEPNRELGDVYDNTYAVLKQYAKVPGNVHFYAGTYEQAKRFFDIGFTVSFTGVITFAKVYEEVVQAVPLDLIHAETDCPYVSPVPHRGNRCEPWMVEEVYKKIAAIKNQTVEEVAEQLRLNAQKLYSFS